MLQSRIHIDILSNLFTRVPPNLLHRGYRVMLPFKFPTRIHEKERAIDKDKTRSAI